MASHTAPKIPTIYTIRRQKVILDSDLAKLYQVRTSRLNEAIKRNISRFPADFRFQLNAHEATNLISQIATSSSVHGGRRKLPWVLTEHGALMAATVLKSPRAIQMSLYLVRAFVRMRDELNATADILRRLSEIDKKLLMHDTVLRDVYTKLLPLLSPQVDESPKRKIGFHEGNR